MIVDSLFNKSYWKAQFFSIFLEEHQIAHKKVTCCNDDNCNGGQGKLKTQTYSILFAIAFVIISV